MHLILHPEPLEERLLRRCAILPRCFTQGEAIEEGAERARETIAPDTEGLTVPEEEEHPRPIIVEVVAWPTTASGMPECSLVQVSCIVDGDEIPEDEENIQTVVIAIAA